jgi:proline dehydrogenase
MALAGRLLSGDAQRAGVKFAFATHDAALIERICAAAGAAGLAKDSIEFQFLYGIQTGEQLRLVREGYRVRVLISYGTAWFAWYMRRLAERPANLWFVARNLVAS